MNRFGRLLGLIVAIGGFAAAHVLVQVGNAQVPPLPTVSVTTPVPVPTVTSPVPAPPPPTVTVPTVPVPAPPPPTPTHRRRRHPLCLRHRRPRRFCAVRPRASACSPAGAERSVRDDRPGPAEHPEDGTTRPWRPVDRVTKPSSGSSFCDWIKPGQATPGGSPTPTPAGGSVVMIAGSPAGCSAGGCDTGPAKRQPKGGIGSAEAGRAQAEDAEPRQCSARLHPRSGGPPLPDRARPGAVMPGSRRHPSQGTQRPQLRQLRRPCPGPQARPGRLPDLAFADPAVRPGAPTEFVRVVSPRRSVPLPDSARNRPATRLREPATFSTPWIELVGAIPPASRHARPERPIAQVASAQKKTSPTGTMKKRRASSRTSARSAATPPSSRSSRSPYWCSSAALARHGRARDEVPARQLESLTAVGRSSGDPLFHTRSRGAV